MWKPVYDPGPWSQFLKRKDIIGLPLKEAKRKFLKEQLDYDNFITQQQLVLKGISPKGPKAPTELVSIPDFGGLLRYADYKANTCPTPTVDIFAQNFGPDYVDSIVLETTLVSDSTWRIDFKSSVGKENTSIHINADVAGANPILTGGVTPTLEVIPQFQGRENVLKLTLPPQLAGLTPRFHIEITTDLTPKNLWYNTHTYSTAFGLWGDGFGWDGNYTSNNVAVMTGSSTLLLFLATLSPSNPDPLYGRGFSWVADQWNDDRTIEEAILWPSGANTGWGRQYTRIWVWGESLPLDPVTFYSPEYVFYISDFNFRLCPI